MRGVASKRITNSKNNFSFEHATMLRPCGCLKLVCTGPFFENYSYSEALDVMLRDVLQTAAIISCRYHKSPRSEKLPFCYPLCMKVRVNS